MLRLEALTPEARAIEDLQRLFEDEQRRGTLKPGSATVNRLNDLFKQAGTWPKEASWRLADVAERIFSDPRVGWGSGDKKRERKAKVEVLKRPTTS